MAQQSQRQATHLVDLVSVIWGRLWLILLCLGGVLAPIVYHNYTAHPVYEAHTSILFEESAQPIQTFALTDVFTRKSFLTNQIEIIKSRTLAEAVVDALPSEMGPLISPHVDAAEHGEWTDKVVNVLTLGRTRRNSNPVPVKKIERERELASIVRNSIQASPVRDSDIIEITVSANSPEAAMVMANTVTDVLEQRSLDFKREEVRLTREFIGTQLTEFKKHLDQAEETLKEFKELNQVTSLQDAGREVLRRVTEVEVLYNRVKSERQGVEQRLSYLDEKLIESKETIVPDITRSSSPYIQQLQSNIVRLEVERVRLLLQEVPEDHPKVQGLERQISDNKDQLRRAAAEIVDGAILINPVSQMETWVQQGLSLRVDLVALRAQEQTLKRALEEYERGLQTLPEKELQLAQLMRAQKVNEQIYLMLHQRYQEARITEAGQLGNIRVIDPAELPRSPVRPRKQLNLILGVIVGLTLGTGLAFLFESLDVSLRTVEDVENQTTLSVLGLVPLRRGRTRRDTNADGPPFSEDLVVFHRPKSPDAESYRTLRTNVQFAGESRGVKTLLITSSGPGEGKSDTVGNLGIAMAQAGIRTLLVDADLRRSALHKLFDMEGTPGLADVLRGEKTPEEAAQATGIDHLEVMPRGTPVGTPSEMLRSQSMKDLLETLKGQYDVVLIDSPPIMAVTDAVLLSAEVDGVCLVAESGRTHPDVLVRANEQLKHAQARILGVVLNKFDVQHSYRSSHYYYQYYYYYYYSDEGKKSKRRRRGSPRSA